MRNALLLFKKPVGWISGGAKFGNTRAWGKKTLPNLFIGKTFTGTSWVDNGDGSYTHTPGTATILTCGDIGLVDGQTYQFVFDVTVTAGDVTPVVNGTTGTTRTASGTYSEIIIAGAVTNNGINPNTLFDGTVSNLRLFKT